MPEVFRLSDAYVHKTSDLVQNGTQHDIYRRRKKKCNKIKFSEHFAMNLKHKMRCKHKTSDERAEGEETAFHQITKYLC